MGMVFCRGCGKEIHESAIACPTCGAQQKITSSYNDGIPDGVRGWSWGAFLLNWIWAISNRVWWGLLAIIPYVGFIAAIWLGIKGRELAWKSREWESVEHFQRVQKKWSNWAVGLTVGIISIGILAAVAIPAYVAYKNKVIEQQSVVETAPAPKAEPIYEAPPAPVVEQPLQASENSDKPIGYESQSDREELKNVEALPSNQEEVVDNQTVPETQTTNR